MDNIMMTTYFISTGLTTLMLGVIGFFLRQFYLTVKELTRTVDKLNIVVTVEGERINNIKESYKNSLQSIENLHKSVNSNCNRITVLETKIN